MNWQDYEKFYENFAWGSIFAAGIIIIICAITCIIGFLVRVLWPLLAA